MGPVTSSQCSFASAQSCSALLSGVAQAPEQAWERRLGSQGSEEGLGSAADPAAGGVSSSVFEMGKRKCCFKCGSTLIEGISQNINSRPLAVSRDLCTWMAFYWLNGHLDCSRKWNFLNNSQWLQKSNSHIWGLLPLSPPTFPVCLSIYLCNFGQVMSPE